MSELDDDLDNEKRHISDLLRRAKVRLLETQGEADRLQQDGAKAAAGGDAKAAGEFERRSQKLRARQRRYTDLVHELQGAPDHLAAEVLLARLQGPETDVLVGEIERSAELVIQRATAVLKARDAHRALRQRWNELSDKIRALRETRGAPTGRSVPVDFRVHVNPQTYTLKPDGPTLREVSDLVHELGL
jgi:hypothetical protein